MCGVCVYKSLMIEILFCSRETNLKYTSIQGLKKLIMELNFQ